MQRALADNTTLSELLSQWQSTISKKIELLAGVADTGQIKDAFPLRGWDSSEFVRRVRSDPSVTVKTAKKILTPMRTVQRELNELAAALEHDGPDVLRLLGFVIVDFVSVENALYGRFPFLESHSN